MRLSWFVLLMFLTEAMNSSNLCWDYKIKDPRLKRANIEHDSECTCPCWQYPHTAGTNNFYKCQVCNHRLTPPDPTSKKGPQYKRFYHKGERDFNPTLFKYPSRYSEKNPKPLVQTKKQNFSERFKTIKKI
jgi:hypothetical protein